MKEEEQKVFHWEPDHHRLEGHPEMVYVHEGMMTGYDASNDVKNCLYYLMASKDKLSWFNKEIIDALICPIQQHMLEILEEMKR